MSFRSLRERRLLSQERLAELSGLSLRTIQRVEAGYRVSYSSLRALAATLEIDVDLLERQLYAAMSGSSDEFVETPRWVRLLSGKGWLEGPRVSRRDAQKAEALLMTCAIVLLSTSFLATRVVAVRALRYGALIELLCAYVLSVFDRIALTYKLWPSAEDSSKSIFEVGWAGVFHRPSAGEWRFIALVIALSVLVWMGLALAVR